MTMKTDEAGALRWQGVGPKERSKLGRAAAESRWANATAEERAAHGKMLAAARKKKRRKAK